MHLLTSLTIQTSEDDVLHASKTIDWRFPHISKHWHIAKKNVANKENDKFD